MSSIQVVGLLVPEMVKIGPIWVDIGSLWSDIGPKSGQQQFFFLILPEMTQNGLEMVPIASGGPGNRFV